MMARDLMVSFGSVIMLLFCDFLFPEGTYAKYGSSVRAHCWPLFVRGVSPRSNQDITVIANHCAGCSQLDS